VGEIVEDCVVVKDGVRVAREVAELLKEGLFDTVAVVFSWGEPVTVMV